MDPRLLSGAITPRSRAVIGVHLTDNPYPETTMQNCAERRFFREDAARLTAARFEGNAQARSARSLFQLIPGQELRCIRRRRLVTTDDTELAERTRRLRDRWPDHEIWHHEVGFQLPDGCDPGRRVELQTNLPRRME